MVNFPNVKANKLLDNPVQTEVWLHMIFTKHYMEERTSFTFWPLYRKAICPWDTLDNKNLGPHRQPTHGDPTHSPSLQWLPDLELFTNAKEQLPVGYSHCLGWRHCCMKWHCWLRGWVLNSVAAFSAEGVWSSVEFSCSPSQHCATQRVYQSHDAVGSSHGETRTAWGTCGSGVNVVVMMVVVLVVVMVVVLASSGSPCQGWRWWIGAWGQGTHRGCMAPRPPMVLHPAAAPGGDMWYYCPLPPRTPYGTHHSWHLLGHTYRNHSHCWVTQNLHQHSLSCVDSQELRQAEQ